MVGLGLVRRFVSSTFIHEDFNVMMPTHDELMTRIVPSIGVVVGTLMFLSPLKAVLDMRRSGRIGVRLCTAPGSGSFSWTPTKMFPPRSNSCKNLAFAQP